MERITEEIIFEYEGLADIAPTTEVYKKFVGSGYRIVSKQTVGGKHIHIRVFRQVKELIA